MSHSEASADVADDYRQSLEELSMNSRYEIANLTVIARENYEHAQAIADVIQEHIKKVAPHKKLPALYVLDSVVKNVGTPYTLYFGRKLYSTFMEAYASVDQPTRRKMDEMLKTWKEPIPGSIDPRPPFPPDVVRPIENALIQARTSAFQQQQENLRGQHQLLSRGRPQQPPPQYRSTPTPPGARPGSLPQGPYGQPPFPGPNGHPTRESATPVGQQGAFPIVSQQAQPQSSSTLTPTLAQSGPYSIPQHPPSAPPALPFQQPPPQGLYGSAVPGISIDALNNDIQQLIAAAKAEFAQNPLDSSIQTRLKALLDLQGLLQSQNLPQDQLVLVKNQVAELAVKIGAPNALLPFHPTALTHTPTPPQQQALALPLSSAPSASAPPTVAVAPPPAASVSIDSLFGQGALATLLAGGRKPAAAGAISQVSFPAATPPAVASALARTRSPLAQAAQPAPALPTDAMSLVGLLRKQGLLPSSGQPAAASPQSLQAAVGLAGRAPTTAATALLEAPGAEIPLKAASLKQFRPHLIPLLYDALGKPCTQCGRRFPTDAEGRRRKTAHLDWHFRTHQRMAEAEKRGQHRSWYVDQRDWIHSREAIDVDHVDDPAGSGEAGSGTGAIGGRLDGAATSAAGDRKGAQVQYLPVPDDPSINTVCPICQEKFEMKWLEEAQEWVWVDAVKVGDRVFHASCHAEATRDGGSGGGSGAKRGARGGTPGGLVRGTPEPVLGKRKAEDGSPGLRGKTKVEPY